MVQIGISQCLLNREFPEFFKTHPTFICRSIFKASRSFQTKPATLSCHLCTVQFSPDKSIAVKIDSERIKSSDEDVESHVKLVISNQERVVNVLLYYCRSLNVFKLVYIPVANIFDLDSMAVV